MDLQKEREAFEAWHYEQYLLENPNIDISNAKYIYDYAHKNALVFQLKESHFLAWQAAKAQAVPDGFVVVPESEYNEIAQYKGLYKRAIVNARKRKNQINWAHVAGLGVGSGRAVELCKELKIDPHATDMKAMLEASQEPANDL